MFEYVMHKLGQETDVSRLSRETGLDRSWLAKLKAGVISEPGVQKIEKLYLHYRLLEDAA